MRSISSREHHAKYNAPPSHRLSKSGREEYIRNLATVALAHVISFASHAGKTFMNTTNAIRDNVSRALFPAALEAATGPRKVEGQQPHERRAITA
jgi:alpha-D-ribose 1-methylphosphonate 5-triphosphate diphosphatase PhnM